VAHYTGALLHALAGGFPEDEWLLFVPGRGDHPLLGPLRKRGNVTIRRHPLPGRLLYGAAAVTGRPRLDRLIGEPVDVVWAPAIAPLALSPAVPFVLTAHDLSFELRPADFTPYERLWHRLARPRELALRAEFVIVPAAATAAEVTERWGVAGGRVRVVAEGIRKPSAGLDVAGMLEGFALAAGRYLLVVGALEPRKAPDLIARAFAAARQRGLESELVFAGEGRLASRLRGPGLRLLGRVSDDQLDALYAGALALVVPSLLEGWGLPLYEALARGIPAVVSDLPVFGEELSSAVLRFPVGDQPALTQSLLRIERDDVERAQLARAAAPAVAGLTWEAAAQRTRAVLAQAAAGRQ
jgi:glycosyltransferase involved in cell wall biosynthesis